ncbi:unnamed protein product [Polarella glacialis]|uniref:Rhodanese domain-containing protein n=1 Tax=Polarella glacialis TaxID=89957 RepID=A0A813JUV0_POLGL|nr:unnamed protein product [Polarella glacialis]
MECGLVSCEWLKEQLDKAAPNLRIVDATWFLPNSPFAAPQGSKGAAGDYLAGPRLPGAVFFDIDAVATHGDLPHMLPNEATFAAAMGALGIEPGTDVVAYDRLGIFSAPRFWYTLKVAFGHTGEVAVLNGGLPRWQELGFTVESGDLPEPPPPAPMASWKLDARAVWDLEQVEANIAKPEALVLDARAAARFHGEAPEPRAGMRGGHIPGSLNVPFVALLSSGPGARTMLPPTELRGVLQSAGLDLAGLSSTDGQPVVISCGSGLTACVVGLALYQAGFPLQRWSVYDGAWSEWGARQDTPILRRGADGQEEPVP